MQNTCYNLKMETILKFDLENCCSLLRKAIEAHGGLEKWLQVEEFVIKARTGGIALPLRCQPSAFKSIEAYISTKETMTVIVPHPRRGQKGIFDEKCVKILNSDDHVIAERKNPRAFFSTLRRKIYWDSLDVLYFGGYALWNYLNLPFLLAQQDFIVKQIEPWEEEGGFFNRLHVIFPAHLHSHCREQIFYFNSSNLLVRHDYTAEVFGKWAKAAHYSWNHRDFGGIVIPTCRRVFPRRRSGHPLRLITLISIDINDVKIVK